MILHFTIAGRACAVDSTAAVDLARPLGFGEGQPSWFGAGPARSRALRAGGFVGDTRLGGSCNVSVLEVIPHCQGTHTESWGHLCDTCDPLPELLAETLFPASLIRVRAGTAGGSPDTLPPTAADTDRVLDVRALRPRLATLAAGFHRALVLALEEDDTDPGAPPAYLSPEAVLLLLAAGVQHLLVEFPSLDRLEDGGLLCAHRAFWGLGPGSRQRPAAEARGRTVTELIRVPAGLVAGPGLLELGIAPLAGDASPSRPRFHPLLPVVPGAHTAKEPL